MVTQKENLNTMEEIREDLINAFNTLGNTLIILGTIGLLMQFVFLEGETLNIKYVSFNMLLNFILCSMGISLKIVKRKLK